MKIDKWGKTKCSFKDYLVKNWKNILAYGVIFFIAAFTLLFIYYDNVSKQLLNPYVEVTVPRPDQGTQTTSLEIPKGLIVEQNIVVPGDKFSGFSILIENGGGLTKGELGVSLIGADTLTSVQEWKIDMTECGFNGYCFFNLDREIETTPGDEYTVLIDTSEITGQDMILTVYHSKTDENSVFINGDGEKNEALCYQIVGGTYQNLKALYKVFLFLILGGIVLGFFAFSKNLKIEFSFAALAMIIGVTYLFVIPPWSTQDGEAHFATAYAESSILLGRDAVDEDGRTIVEDGIDDLAFYNPRPGKASYVTYWNGLTGQEQIMDAGTGTLREPLSMDNLGYVPQVLGITIGRVLDMTAEQIFFCGRLFAMIWHCVIMFWAIRIIPIGKLALFIIGLLPMVMQQAVSYNYDSILNSVCFFLFAYLLRLIFDKSQVNIKDIVVVSACAVIIAQIKFIYLPICFLGFAIPSKKFGGARRKAGGILGVGIVAVVFMLFRELDRITNIFSQNSVGGTGLKVPGYSLGYCVGHPIETGIIIFRTLKDNFSFYVESMLGGRLGWHHEIVIPTVIIMGFAILLYVSTLKRKRESYSVTWKEKLISVIVILAIGGLVVFALLIGENTSLDATTIWGIQGRYFLPILPFVLLMCRTDKIVISENGEQWVVCAVHVLQICTVINIIATIVAG